MSKFAESLIFQISLYDFESKKQPWVVVSIKDLWDFHLSKVLGLLPPETYTCTWQSRSLKARSTKRQQLRRFLDYQQWWARGVVGQLVPFVSLLVWIKIFFRLMSTWYNIAKVSKLRNHCDWPKILSALHWMSRNVLNVKIGNFSLNV